MPRSNHDGRGTSAGVLAPANARARPTDGWESTGGWEAPHGTAPPSDEPQLPHAPRSRFDLKTLAEVRVLVLAERDELCNARAADAAVALLDRALDARDTDHAQDRAALRRVLLAIAALDTHAMRGGLSPAQVRAVTKLADGLLRELGIKPGTSRFDVLHDDLCLARSRALLRDGDVWGSLGAAQLGVALGRHARTTRTSAHLLAEAVRAWRLGHAAVALAALDGVHNTELDLGDSELSRLLRIKILRLSCCRDDATRALATATPSRLDSDAFQREYTWERLALDACANARLAPLMAATQRRGTHDELSYALDAVALLQGAR